MKQIDLYVNNEYGEELHYKVQVATSEEDKKDGLKGVDKLEPDEGMLFVYDDEQELSFWMKDVRIPLTVAFIDEDMEIVAVYDAAQYDETPMIEKAKYVLEVSAGEDISEGDDVVFDLDDDKYDFEKSPLLLLNEDGSVQAKLKGGERVVSRNETRIIIRKAKLCKRWKNKSKTKYEKYCKELGRYIFKVFEGQDNRPVETVETP